MDRVVNPAAVAYDFGRLPRSCTELFRKTLNLRAATGAGKQARKVGWFFLGCLLTLLGPALSSAATFNWTGSVSSDWFNTNNWNPVGIPATNDNVNFSVGTINFTAPVVFSGQFNWSGGTLTGSGLTIATNGSLSLTGTGAKYLYAVLTNAGTVAVTGTGGFYIYNNNGGYQGAVYNLAGGLWDFQADGPIYCACYGYEFFNNAGTLRKSAAGGTSPISVPLNNSGVVSVLQGTLSLSGGGRMEGSFSAAAGTTINFSGGSFSYSTMPVMTGPGLIEMTGGSLAILNTLIPNLQLVGGTISLGANFQGGTITNLTSGATINGSVVVSGVFNCGGGVSGSVFVTNGAVFNLSGGTVTGGMTTTNGSAVNWSGGTITGNSLVAGGAGLTWSAGTMNGPLTIATNGLVTLSGTGGKFLYAVLTNAGTVAVTGTGGFYIYNNNGGYQGAVYNLAGGLWDFQADGPIYCACYGYEFFNNAGTLRKSAAGGTSPISVPLNNSGVVSVLQGTLSLSGGGRMEGSFSAAAGTTINFSGGNFSYSAMPVMTGPGLIEMTGGSLAILNTLIPNLQLVGGTISLGANFQGGTITNLTSGATINGSVVVSGVFNCGGGVSGSVFVTNGAVFNLSGGTVTGGMTTTNGSAVNWSGGTITGNSLVAGGAGLTWSAGTMNGPLTIATNGLVTLSGTGGKFLYAVLTNAGTVAVTGTGGFYIYNNNGGYQGAVYNLAGGLWDFQADGPIYCACYGYEFFNNAGTLRKSAAGGTSPISVPLNNSGVVSVLQGTLSLSGGGRMEGSFSAAAGTTINFSGGSFSYSTMPVMTGPGLIEMTGGSLAILNTLIPNLQLVGGTISLGANFQGGTITNLTSGATINGSVVVSGVFNCGGGVSGSVFVTNGAVFNLSGGTVTGGMTTTNGSAVNWSGGTITGNSLVAGGAGLTWSAGTMNGPLTIATNGLVTLSGTGGKFLYAVLTNAGTVAVTGTGGLYIYNSNGGYQGAVYNLAGGLWDFQADAPIYCACYGYEFFNNAGLLRKSQGTGSSTLGVNFTNTGTVSVLSGTLSFGFGNFGGIFTAANGTTLNLNNGGILSGTFTAGFGAAINLTGGQFTQTPSVSFSGAGTFSMTGGGVTLLTDVVPNLQLLGGTISLSPSFQGGTITNFTLYGGTLSGSYSVSGNLNLYGVTIGGGLTVLGGSVMNWSGGSLGQSSVVTVLSNALLNLAGGIYLDGVLTNRGTVVWQGNYITVRNNGGSYAGAIWNQAGGLWDIQCDQSLGNYWGGEQFHNLGILRKSGTGGVTTFQVYLNNSGTVQVQSGTLQLNNSSDLGGIFQAAAGATVNLAGGNYTGGTSVSLGGAGSYQFTGGNLALTDSIIPNLQIAGGTVSLSTNFQGGTITNLSLYAGTLSGSYQVSGSLNLSGGTSSGNLTVLGGGTANFSTANLGQSSALTVLSNALLNLAGGVYLDGVLTNRGTVVWQGNYITVRNNGGSYTGAIWNQAGGLWDIQCDQSLGNYWGGEQFHNLGILRKSGAGGVTTFQVYLNNSGTVQVQSGTLQLNNSSDLGGIFQAAAGATVNLAGGNYTGGTSVSLAGAGSYQFTGGNLALTDSIIPNLQIAGGTVSLSTNFQGGTITNLSITGATLSGSYAVSGNLSLNSMTVSGSLSALAGGAINWFASNLGQSSALTVRSNGLLNLNGGIYFDGAVTNQGKIVWQGNYITVRNSGGSYTGAIWNEAGALFDIQCDQALGNYWGGEQFQNAGVLRKSVGTGTTTFQVLFANSNTLDIQTGGISFNNTFTQTSGTWNFGLNGPANFGRIAISGSAPLNGALNVSLNNGYVPALNSSFALATYGSRNGNFASVSLPTGGLFWQLNYGTTALNLVLTNYAAPVVTITSPTNNSTFIGPLNITINTSVQDTNAAITKVEFFQGTNKLGESLSGPYSFTWNNAVPGLYSLTAKASDAVGASTVSSPINITIFSTDPRQTTNFVWTGAISTDWFTAANWSPIGVPGGLDNVIITNGGTVNVGGNVSVNNVNFAAGILQGAGILSVTNTFNWNAGTITGGLTIQSNATLYVLGGSNHDLPGGTLVILGKVVWTAGSIRGNSSTAITNNGLWLAQSDDQFNSAYGGNYTFVNNGTFRKSLSAGTTTFSGVAFNNSGIVDGQSGVISFSNGGLVGGTYNTASGAYLNLAAGSFLATTAPVVTGSGVSQLNGGSLTLSYDQIVGLQLAGGSVTLGGAFQNAGAITNLTLSGASLTGTNRVTGTFTWAAGTLAGPLTVANTGTLNITPVSNHDLPSVSLTNLGTVVWTGGQIRGNSATLMVNAGLWLAQSDDQLNGAYGGAPTFNNSGTFRKQGSGGTTQLNGVAFNNSGLLDAQIGTISLTGGGTVGGSWNMSAGSVISLANGSFTLGNPPAITGTGLCQFVGGTLTLLNDVAPALQLSGGTIVLGPAFQNVGAITNLALSGATLSGSNTVTGTFTWKAGLLNGVLTVASNATMSVVSSSNHDLPNAAWTNFGTVVWTGGQIRGNSATLMANAGLWLAQSDDQFNGAYGGSPTFSNTGTFRKQGSGGSTLFSGVVFNNYGLVDAQSGTVTFAGGGLVGGSYNSVPSTGINLSGGTFTSGGAPSFSAGGYSQLSGGNLTLSYDQIPNLQLVGGTVTLGPFFQQGGSITNLTLSGSALAGSNTVAGTMNWVAGTLNGSLMVLTNGLLNLTGGANKDMPSSALVNFGTVIWSGGTIRGNSGTGITNGGLWLAQSDDAVNNAYGGTPAFINSGTFRKSGTFGTTTFGTVALLNSGTFDIRAGTVSCNSGSYAQTGATLNFGASAANIAGRLSLSGSVNFDGYLGLNLLNGYTPTLGNAITLITYGSYGGAFNTLNLPWLTPNLAWQVAYNPGSVVLLVVAVTNQAAQITGSVQDTLGHAITNINVFAFTTNSPNLYFSANTDSNGNYSINVPSGTFQAGVQGLSARGFNPVANQVAVISNASQVVNFVAQPSSVLQTFTITTAVNPPGSGSASGGGTFSAGATATLLATANTNLLPYVFASWTENGVLQSLSSTYAFPAIRNRQLVANFNLPVFTITVSNNPSSGGSVAGAGSYIFGTTNFLTAHPNFGYNFANWTEGASIAGANLTLTTVVLTNHTFVANYTEANVSHVVAAATSPGGLAAIAGGGTYANGQTANFSAPPFVTNAPFIYAFQRFTLSNTVVSVSPAFSKTFSTLDPTNLFYVAVYAASTILPQITNVNVSVANPVPATTNFIIAFQFDRPMNTNTAPTVVLTNAGAVLQASVSGSGSWASIVLSNDTYFTPPISFVTGMDGTNQVFVSGGKDLSGNGLVLTNVFSVIVDATPPATPVLSLVSSNSSSVVVGWSNYVGPSDLNGFRIYLQRSSFSSVAGLPPVTSLGVEARSVQLAGLLLDTPYYVAVQAFDVAGNSPVAATPLQFTIPSSVPPPVALQESPVGATSALLTWSGYNTAGLLGFAGFRVYYEQTNLTSVASLVSRATLSPGASSFQVDGLDRTHPYYFAVVGYNSAGGYNAAVSTVGWSDPYAGNIGVSRSIGGSSPSVVNIYQSINVVSNATLTIQPGTTLLFAPGTSLSVQQGSLVANGTALNPVVFDSSNDTLGKTPAPGDWGGVTLGGGASGSALRFVQVLYGQGLTLNGCAPVVDAFTASYNTPFGLGLQGGATLVTSNALVTANPIGIRQSDTAYLTIQNSVIKNNGTNALAAGSSPLNATADWWGTSVEASLTPLLQGNVTYNPFLGYEPLLTPAIGTPDGLTQVGNAVVTLKLACRTGDAMRVSEDYSFNGVFFVPFTNYTAFPLSAGGGLKRIYAQYRSITGQTNTPIELDLNYITAGPVIQSFSLNQGQTLSRPLTVTGSATAALGMLAMEFYVDGVLWATNAGGSFSQYFDVRTLNNAVHQVQLVARDTSGHIASIANNVVVAVAPPPAPVITVPPADILTNINSILVSGTAEPGITIQVTRNGQVLLVTNVAASGNFSLASASLVEGDNQIVAVASDSIGTTPSVARHVLVETVPPAAAVMGTPVYTPGSGLGLFWHNSATGKPAASFQLFWGTSPFATTNQASGHTVLLKQVGYTVSALADGTYYFGVVGYDDVGNPSPLSGLVSAVYDATPPALTVSYSQPSPVGGGPVNVMLTSSKPLAATPALTIKPQGAASPILLSLTNVALNTWQTTFGVAAGTPSGLATLNASAQDQVGNVFNGAPSGPQLIIDTTPPAGNLVVTPGAPVQTVNTTNVTVSLTLTESAGPGTTPTLTFAPPVGTNLPVSLFGSGSSWSGILTLTPAMGSGFGRFAFSGQDSVGNIGTNLLSGASLELYNTALPAPPAAPSGLVASSLPGGWVSLKWNVSSNAQVYRLYREPGTNLVTPAVLDLDNLTSNQVADLPLTDGSYRYGVSASRLGSESGISNVVVGVSDRTPPLAPTNVAVALAASGVQVTWQEPSGGPAPDHYNLYRNGVLFQTVSTVTLVADYPPRGTNSYVVAAVDAVGNENPSTPAVIQLLVSPVSHLAVLASLGQAPVLIWASTDPTATGYNLYRNGVKQNAALLTTTNYTDNLPLADAVQYALTAVNASAQESPPRLVTVYPVGLGLLVNAAGGPTNNALFTGYFDQYQVGVTNLAAGSNFALAQIQMFRVITGQEPFALSSNVATNLGAGMAAQQSFIIPESPIVATQTVQVTAVQQTDSGGSSVTYQQVFTLGDVHLSGAQVAISINQLPLVGGLSSFQVQLFNRGYADMQAIVSRGSGAQPGDVYISVLNSLGQEVSRTAFQGAPAGTTFLPDGRAYVNIAAGASLGFTVPGVLVPAALAGATNVSFVAVVSKIYNQLSKPAELVSGPLSGSMVSSGLAQTPYYGTAQTDHAGYQNDMPILITGQALDRVSGNPVPNAGLQIGFAAHGFRWYRNVTTDTNGNYQYVFNNPLGFAGSMTIWAAHPQVVDLLNQVQVSVYRLYLSPPAADIRMSKNDTLNFSIQLNNPGDVPLSGFVTGFRAYQVSGTNQIPVTKVTGTNLVWPGFVLGPNQKQSINLQLAAASDAPDNVMVEFTFTSVEGAAATFVGTVTLLPAVPVLSVASPAVGYLEMTLDRGDQRSGQITVLNSGLRDLQGVTLIPPTNIAWMFVNLPVSQDGQLHLPDLAVGQSNSFTVVFAPPAATPLAFYSDQVRIHGTNAASDFLVNVYALVSSSLTGGVQFEIDDILGEQVPGAAIRLHNNLLQADVGPFYTDTNGFVTVANLQEGTWDWQVSAPGCSANVGTVSVIPGQTLYQHSRLSRSLVTVSFTVVPVPFTDTYEIKVEQTFETHVPAGVLVLDPPYIDFKKVTSGFSANFIVKVQNQGLIQMTDVTIKGQDANGGTLQPMIDYMPVLLPMQTVEVPFLFTYNNPNASGNPQSRQSAIGDCFMGALGGAFGFGDIMNPDVAAGLAAIFGAQERCARDLDPQTAAALLAATYGLAQLIGLWGDAEGFVAGLVAQFVGCIAGNLLSGLLGVSTAATAVAPSSSPAYVGTPVGCFPADTQVWMADGSWKPISAIHTNELVRTGLDAGKFAVVQAVYELKTSELSELRLGRGARRTPAFLRATGEHQIWVDGKGWVLARDVTPGDWLFDNEGHRVEVLGNHVLKKEAEVYTISLSGDNVFYADGVLVHDMCGRQTASMRSVNLGVAK